MTDVKVFPPMSEREIRGAEISRYAAAEGMVLLKNDNAVLPLAPGQTVALFGNGAARTVRGGTGSGDPFNGGLSGGGGSAHQRSAGVAGGGPDLQLRQDAGGLADPAQQYFGHPLRPVHPHV